MRASSETNSTLYGKDPQASLELLHATMLTGARLCTETPRAGGRIFEAGDENLLRLAYRTQSTFLPTAHLTQDGSVDVHVISSCCDRLHEV
jgi:hypothetical protein